MASIQKKNNKDCVVYYCKDIEGKVLFLENFFKNTKNEAKIRKAEIELKEKKAVSSYRTVRRCRI